MGTAAAAGVAGNAMTRPADDDAVTAARIVDYLSAHPEAADTAEGVARWWLHSQPPVTTLERALAMLVAQRLVEQHELPDGTVVFRSGPGLSGSRASSRQGAPSGRRGETE